MAASVMATPASIAQATQAMRTPPPAASPAIHRTPPPPAPPPLGPGAVVSVRWADGNRYQGKVLQASGQQALVAFSNGAQHWIDMQYLSPGG